MLALFSNFFSANYILHIQNYRNYTLLLDITFTQHTCNLSYLQSSTVVTRSNLSRYYIRHCNNIGRKWIIFKDHDRHPIPRPNGRAELWDVYCEEFGENWPRFNGTALYFAILWSYECAIIYYFHVAHVFTQYMHCVLVLNRNCRKVSNIRRTKSQNLNVSRLNL